MKFKMTAAAILNYNFVMLDHPWSPFVHLKFTFKFRVDRVHTFGDIVIRKFHKFGLKCLFRPQKSCFRGVLTPKHFLSSKGPTLRWATNGRDRSSGVTCRREQEYKKGLNTKSNEKFPHYVDPFPVVPHQPNFACGVVFWISFLVSCFIKISWKMWEQWGVEILAFPLTWHIAYTTACGYRTSHDQKRMGSAPSRINVTLLLLEWVTVYG